jgi:hypothetical protein
MTTLTTMLDGCDDAVPTREITREFEFGQFIELFDPGAGPNPVPVPIVIDPIGNLKLADLAGHAAAAATGTASTSAAATGAGANPELYRLGGRSLQGLLRTKEADALADFVIDDLAALAAKPRAVINDVEYTFVLTAAQESALADGAPAFLEAAPKNGAPVIVRALLRTDRVVLEREAIDKALARSAIQDKDKNGQAVRIRITADAARSLLAGRSATVVELTSSGGGVVRRLAIEPVHGAPAPGQRTISDLAGFLAAPTAPDALGQEVPLALDAEVVAQLRGKGEALLKVPGGVLHLVVVASSSHAATDTSRANDRSDVYGQDKEPGSGRATPVGSGGSAAVPASAPPAPAVVYIPSVFTVSTYTPPPAPGTGGRGVEPRLPSGRGIPVAVMVPWRQTWTLAGFSRGALLSSLPLTPQEEVLIEMHSWERRTRSLDQSSEAESEQSFESLDTTKDTDETFNELTKKQDFTWQVAGSLDVSYSPGVASINVSASASAESVQNLASVARTTTSRMREATTKAAAKVRSRRVTSISETVETGSDNRVTRRIRNPNLTRTVTYDFFETLAHYTVTTAFQPERLAVVALIRNPEMRQPAEFTPTLIRQNESTFRNALLEPSLADGFAALRLLAAYDAGRAVLDDRANAAKLARLVQQQQQPAADQPTLAPDPAAQQKAAVLDALRGVHEAAKTVRTNANIDTALQRIREQNENHWAPMNESERRNAQHWLFTQCLAARMPSLLDKMQQLATVAAADLSVSHAQQLVAVMPPPGSPRTLSSLSELTAREKEECGLESAINRWKRIFWDWDWWTTRCREELLYTPNDAGFVGYAEKLQKALGEWEAKRAEGAFVQDKDVALQQGEAKQDAATTDDRLAMAFPLDEHARAIERADALLGHVAAHPHHYSYVLFHALTPSEQVTRILAAAGGQLQVGLFEPRVVAMHGERLAVPLTALAIGGLGDFMATVRTVLAGALAGTAATPDTVILPTPGVTVNSRLGKCSAAESFVEDSRAIDVELQRARLAQAKAEAESAAAEARRRQLLLEAKTLTPFDAPEA